MNADHIIQTTIGDLSPPEEEVFEVMTPDREQTIGYTHTLEDAHRLDAADDLLSALRSLHGAMKDSRDRGLYRDELNAAEDAITRAAGGADA